MSNEGGRPITGQMPFAERLRWRMKDLGVTQAGLATRAGVHERTVGYLLSGETKEPETVTLAKLAGALGTTMEELWTGEGERSASGMEERWLLGEYRRLEKDQRGELLEYLRDVGDMQEGRVRRNGLRRPKEEEMEEDEAFEWDGESDQEGEDG